MRQVTHALLTRPPLSRKIFISEENQIKRFVRLACVRHAASVHPEPGSNSHVQVSFCSSKRFPPFRAFRTLLAFQVSSPSLRESVCLHSAKPFWFPVFTVLGSSVPDRISSIYRLKFSKSFQGLFTVQLSRFVCCCPSCCSSDSLFTISLLQLLVNNFFYFIFLRFAFASHSAWIWYLILRILSTAFSTFF